MFFSVVSILVLNEIDKLPEEARHSLQRAMEKYSAYCHLLLCCNGSPKVIEFFRSRCRNVTINALAGERKKRLDKLLA